MKKVFGIDLGTTYSCISVVDEHNKPIIISNMDGERITPSVVYFEDLGDGQINIDVGANAKSYAEMYPENVVSFIKRQMGSEFTFELNEGSYRPETISSLILKKLAESAEQATGEKVEDVVITVPAYFGVNEREATRSAGEIAGLNVVGLINEPTAAALAYGITRESNKRILVYDLGGGTFDVTLIDVKPDSIEVIVTGGDENLGGKNWDDMIIEYLVTEFEASTGIAADELLENPETAQVLQAEAEKSKKTLTTRNLAPIRVIHGIERKKIELSREKFEEITQHLIERTIDLTNNMLEDAKKKGPEKAQFDEIILVGGSTRMPQIKQRLMKEFDMEPVFFEPDEAVAKGAALYGQQKSLQDWVQKEIAEINATVYHDVDSTSASTETMTSTASVAESIGKLTAEQKVSLYERASYEFKIAPASIEKMAEQKIQNVTSKSFGVVAMVEVNGTSEERVINIIHKNDNLPCNFSQVFGTYYDNQENAQLQVMENDSMETQIPLDYATIIGDAILELPAGLPEDAPIEVTYTLTEDGRLVVTGIETTKNNIVNVTIQTNSVISKKEIEETKQIIKDFNFA